MGWQVGRLSIVFVSFWGVGRHGLFSPANCPVSFREKLVGKPTPWVGPPTVPPKKFVPFRCEKSCEVAGDLRVSKESPLGPPFLRHGWGFPWFFSPPKKWDDFVEFSKQIAEKIAALKMCLGKKPSPAFTNHEKHINFSKLQGSKNITNPNNALLL